MEKDIKTNKTLTLASALALLLASASANSETAAPDLSQVTEDGRSGLMWTRCFIGSTFVEIDNPDRPNKCEGPSRQFGWNQAIEFADQATIAGFDDWRLPSFKELYQLTNSQKMPSKMFVKFFPGFRDDTDYVMVSDISPGTTWGGSAAYVYAPTSEGNNTFVTSTQISDDGRRSSRYQTPRMAVLLVRNIDSAKNPTNKPIVALPIDANYKVGQNGYPAGSPRIFKDPETGLIWHMGALHGPTPKPPCSNCESQPLSIEWWEAIGLLSRLDINGIKDWRLPSKTELLSFKNKLGKPGYPERISQNCFTSTPTSKVGHVWAFDPWYRQNDGFKEESATVSLEICAVSGPGEDTDFKAGLARLKDWDGSDKFGLFDKQAEIYAAAKAKEDERSRKELADFHEKERAKLAAHRENSERIRKDKENRTRLLRENTKVGDKARQGLVLEVKGELARLQAHEEVCVNKSIQRNTFTGDFDCFKWESRATGSQIWVRRNELQLPMY